jgi:hypothetical protein
MQKLEWYPNLYVQVDFLKKKKFMDRQYFFETQKKLSQYLIKSLPYNSWIPQNGFWYKETDKGA